MKYLPFLLPILLFLFSCDKEDRFTTDSSDKLAFSVDTLRFDTVFTELGSATRFFRVYNRAKESIRISKISLKGNNQSKFNLNVDGIPGDGHEGVVIYPNDSIYVFAEVTINPDDPLSISPFFVYDEVVFETNGNVQSVTLEAWGQNANYFPSRWHKDSVAVYTCAGEVIWDDPKPYVLYGVVAFLDCQLTIPAGARIHVHGGLSRTTDPVDMSTVIYSSGRLFIGENASIQVKGTLEKPVIFEGDRLEEGFEDIDGQWTGLIFARGSRNNSLENATVKNARFGIFVDSAADLTLKNVQVFNTSGPGLFAYHAKVDAENCLFFNNGSHAVQTAYGGDYRFDYCTLANYGTNSAALALSNGICDDPDDCTPATARIFRLNARFRNSIIFGSLADEILLADFTGNLGSDRLAFNYSFEECIIRERDLDDPERGYPDFFNYCSCLSASPTETLFVSISDDDYHLDTLSIAEEKAIPLNSILFDLEGNQRDPVKPDVGCYEYQY